MSGYTVPEADLAGWHQAAEARQDMRGVAAVAKEMESHLRRKDAQGNVSVARHTLFGWAEALEGAALRDPRRASGGAQLSLQQVVADLRAVLGGGTPGAGASRPPSPAAAVSPSSPDWKPASSSPAPRPEPAPAREEPRAAPAPVTYARGGGPGGGGGGEFLPPGQTADEIRRLLRSAREEVLVVSPWTFGLDTLAEELIRLPPNVAVRLVTRRPDRDEPAYHRQMEQITRRGAEARFSPFLQTRMLVVDGQRALVGAASIPPSGAPTREAAVVVSGDAARAAREHFARVFQESGG